MRDSGNRGGKTPKIDGMLSLGKGRVGSEDIGKRDGRGAETEKWEGEGMTD